MDEVITKCTAQDDIAPVADTRLRTRCGIYSVLCRLRHLHPLEARQADRATHGGIAKPDCEKSRLTPSRASTPCDVSRCVNSGSDPLRAPAIILPPRRPSYRPSECL